MKKNDKPKKEQNPQGRVPRQPKGVTELSEQDLKQVQGGQGIPIQKDPHALLATGGDTFYKDPGK